MFMFNNIQSILRLVVLSSVYQILSIALWQNYVLVVLIDEKHQFISKLILW